MRVFLFLQGSLLKFSPFHQKKNPPFTYFLPFSVPELFPSLIFFLSYIFGQPLKFPDFPSSSSPLPFYLLFSLSLSLSLSIQTIRTAPDRTKQTHTLFILEKHRHPHPFTTKTKSNRQRPVFLGHHCSFFTPKENRISCQRIRGETKDIDTFFAIARHKSLSLLSISQLRFLLLRNSLVS